MRLLVIRLFLTSCPLAGTGPKIKLKKQFSKAQYEPDENDVTVCVHLDVSRMIQLNARAKNYAGPISAVIFVVDDEDVEKVKQYVAASVHIRKWVDVHLYNASPKATGEAHIDLPNEPVFEGDAKSLGQKLLYPANLMRNMAVEEARTKWIISIEVDLALAPGAKDVFNRVVTKLMKESKADETEGSGYSSSYSSGYSSGAAADKAVGAAADSTAGQRKAYVVPLLQEQEGECAGGHKQTKVTGAEELPKVGEWSGEENEFTTPSGINIKLSGCNFGSHSFMSYDEFFKGESNGAFMPLPDLKLQDVNKGHTRYEPYFVARKEFLPRYDDGMVFCTHDKIDQMYRMMQVGFEFWAIPNAYLMHIDNDDKADNELHAAREKSDKSYDRHVKEEMKHHGRVLCDIWNDPKYRGLKWVPMAQETTMISWMRFYQTYVSHLSFYGDTDHDRNATKDNDVNQLARGTMEWGDDDEWESHVGPTEAGHQ